MKLLSLALAGTTLLIASTFANASDLAAGKATWEKINWYSSADSAGAATVWKATFQKRSTSL